MCGRYVLKSDLKELEEIYGAVPDGLYPFEPQYNVAPTLKMPVIHQHEGRNEISLYRWGLIPSWSKEVNTRYSMINARISHGKEDISATISKTKMCCPGQWVL